MIEIISMLDTHASLFFLWKRDIRLPKGKTLGLKAMSQLQNKYLGRRERKILFLFFPFRAKLMAYGNFQVRGPIRPVVVGLHHSHSHSHSGSKPFL